MAWTNVEWFAFVCPIKKCLKNVKRFVERSQTWEQHESKSWIRIDHMFASNTSAGSSSQRCWFLTLWGLLIRSRKCAGRASVHVADVSARKTSAVHRRAPSVESKWCTLLLPGLEAIGNNHIVRTDRQSAGQTLQKIQLWLLGSKKKSAGTEYSKAYFGCAQFLEKWSSIFCGNACNIGWILLWFHRSAAREPTCFQK